jgi:hypothetical protein
MAAANDAGGEHGNVDTAIGVGLVAGQRRVILKYHRPVTEIVFEPQNAFEIAEGLARAAYEARFGRKPPDDAREMGYLASQIGKRISGEMRNRYVEKAAFDIKAMLLAGKDPTHIAQQTVDNLLAQVT